METIGGGAGGRSYQDGSDGIQVHVTNTSNLPVEALESEYPLLVERYELVENSGGAGKWRGGMGLRRVYRGLGHTLTFSGQGERAVTPPWGLFGGKGGGTGSISLINPDGSKEELDIKPASLQVEPTKAVCIETPGAGGYGAPVDRDKESLLEDFKSEKFSRSFLKEHYNFEN